MEKRNDSDLIEQYLDYIRNESFPCIAAKAALANQQVSCLVADHLACPHNDAAILNFLYDFVDTFRKSEKLYHSAAILFKGPGEIDEKEFDNLMWMRLQSLANLDSKNFPHDSRVDQDPASAKFSFSLKEEAFFIIGLHGNSSRVTRRFPFPVLTFNPHAQFEQLRNMDKFENMQRVVRKRDFAYSGSVNPMLENYGEVSEVYQYSGREYDNEWECPLKPGNGTSNNNPSA